MGKAFFGGSKISGTQSNLTPEQKSYLSDVIGGIGPQVRAGFESFLQPTDIEGQQNLFEQSYIKPAQQALERNILPSIQQRFVDVGAGRSSALNQALSQAAADVSTQLGSQFGGYQQQQQQALLQALGLLSGQGLQQTQQPVVSQSQGLLGGVLGGIGSYYGSKR